MLCRSIGCPLYASECEQGRHSTRRRRQGNTGSHVDTPTARHYWSAAAFSYVPRLLCEGSPMPAGYTKIHDTGNGATIVFATDAFAADFKMLGEINQEGGHIEDSVLANATYKSFIPSDLIDPGILECELNFDTKMDLPVMHKPQLITITFPKRPGETTAASFAASGFIFKRSTPSLENNKIQSVKISIRFDGKGTEPLFTKAV